MDFNVMHNIRYLLKKGKDGKVRKLVLQEYIDGFWLDIPTVFEEDAEEWEQDNFLNSD